MKRLISVILIAALVLGCLASCAPNDTADSSSKSSSRAVSSRRWFGTASSDDTSSVDISKLIVYGGATENMSAEGFFDVDAEVRRRGLTTADDVSACFKEGVTGYIINESTYKVDADTLVRLTQTPVAGNGTVKWKDFAKAQGNSDQFWGGVPVSKLHDPIYMSMNLPSELQTYMGSRTNGANMYTASSIYSKLISIGAIYKEKDTVLPDDAEITICLGRMTLAICTEEEGWHIINQLNTPTKPNSIYYLPWSLEHTLGSVKIDNSRLVESDDHIEIKLTGAMLNGTYKVPDEYKDQVEGSVLHFWGKNVELDGGTVKGMAVSYVAWIKEPEYVGKVAATIGADWRTPENQISQAFSGMNYKLTTEPRLIFGHNVGPKAYDEIMDTDKVQQLLGLK